MVEQGAMSDETVRSEPDIEVTEHGVTAPAAAGGASGISVRAAALTAGAIAVVILLGDQLSKHWALGALEPYSPVPVIGDLLQFQLLFNSGAAWGMGGSATPIVTVLQLAICIGAAVYLVRSVRSPWWAVAVGLIIGGALGNIHDRLLRAPGPFRGEVVDFLQLPHWPIFNVADMAVVAGAVLVVLFGLLGTPARGRGLRSAR